jgi:hypothetical protein
LPHPFAFPRDERLHDLQLTESRDLKKWYCHLERSEAKSKDLRLFFAL